MARPKILVADWLVLLGMAAILAVVDFAIAPYERVIPADDPTLMYPHLGYETIPTWALVLLAVVLPLVTVVGYSVLSGDYRRDLQPALLAFAMATIGTILLTDITKVTAGRLRPDFYDRCQLVNGVCTGDPKVITEGRKSFVSGHASLAFAGLGFLSMYMAGKLRVFEPRSRLWKLALVLLPLIGAYLITISRVCNYVHHWQDVLVGGVLGYAFAYLSYRHYYPAISDPAGALPHSEYSDIQGSSSGGFPMETTALSTTEAQV